MRWSWARMALWLRAVVPALLLMAAVPANAAAPAERVALVIGNADYEDAALANPTHDADAIESALERLGFDVIKLRNGDLREMQKAIGQFSRKLAGAKVALFYYSGHGIQAQGTNYLVPIGARLESEGDVPLELISLDALMVQLNQAQTPVNIIILDACRNDPFANRMRGRSALAGLAPISAPRGTMIAYATAPGQTADDGEGSNSPFTAALLQVIEKPGLKAEDVFKETRVRLAENTANKQVSWESSSLVGDFYFAAPPAAARGAAPAPAAPAKTEAVADAGKPKSIAKRGKLVFDVENATGDRVSELYFAPLGAKTWPDNALDEDTVIDPKDSIEVTLNDGSDACGYDIMAVFKDGHKKEYQGINICDLQRFVIR